MGCMLLYIAFFILIPFDGLFLRGARLTWDEFVWHAFEPRAVRPVLSDVEVEVEEAAQTLGAAQEFVLIVQ